MKQRARQLLTSIGAVLWTGTFFIVLLLVIMWVTTSFAITGTGKVKWREGWDKTIERFLG